MERIKRYELAGGYNPTYHPDAVCPICGKNGIDNTMAINNETGTEVPVHRGCLKNSPDANVSFPWRLETAKKLKNHLGMGGWFPRRPTKEFFWGLSGSPREKAYVDFESHTVYISDARAERIRESETRS